MKCKVIMMVIVFTMTVCMGCSSFGKKFSKTGRPTSNMTIKEYRQYVVKQVVPVFAKLQRAVDEYVAQNGYKDVLFTGTEANADLNYDLDGFYDEERDSHHRPINESTYHFDGYYSNDGRYTTPRNYNLKVYCNDDKGKHPKQDYKHSASPNLCSIEMNLLDIDSSISSTKSSEGWSEADGNFSGQITWGKNEPWKLLDMIPSNFTGKAKPSRIIFINE